MHTNVLYNMAKKPPFLLYRKAQRGGGSSRLRPLRRAGERILPTPLSKGSGEAARAITQGLCEKMEPMEIVNTLLIPALDEVGNRFETGKIFPAPAAPVGVGGPGGFRDHQGADCVPGDRDGAEGKIVLATVRGGYPRHWQSIVKVILEKLRFPGHRPGPDVPVETVVEAVQEHGARLAGLFRPDDHHPAQHGGHRQGHP